MGSFVAGVGSTASGDYSTALGRSCTAAGSYSFVTGYNSLGNGYATNSIGYGAKSYGEYSVSVGYGSRAGSISTLLGHSIAMGYQATANGDNAVSFGRETSADANYSISVGYIAMANGIYSVSMGIQTYTSGWYSTALGYKGSSQVYKGAVIGFGSATGNHPNSASVWYDDDPVFVVGNGNNSVSNAVTILKNGCVGIGTTAPSDKLVVFNGSTTGQYTTAGWTHSSDARLKENITPLCGSLDKILKLESVRFNFIGDKDKKQQIGFIAQEFEQVFPELVVTDNNGYKSIAYGQLNGVLVEALKEQEQKIDSQQQQIDELKAMVERLLEKTSPDRSGQAVQTP
jgi:hypothetical protein